MKKIAIVTTLFTFLCVGNTWASNDIKLKRSCIKDHPLVDGMSDQALLTVYAEVCDKKNKSNQSPLLSKAAERFQQLGLNYSALKIVSDLEAQGFNNQTLTNTKFLAGVSLADQALTQMREKQLRYLTEDDTYPPAKSLVDNIEKSRPSSALVKEAPKVVTPTVRPQTRTTSSRQGSVSRNTGSTRSNTTNTRNNQTQRVITTPTPPPKSTNPFGSL